MNAGVSEAWTLVRESLDWLREHYADVRFYTERDIVWTVQRWLVGRAEPLGIRVFNDYGIEPGTRRSYSADIALCRDGRVLAAVEFKYEPSSKRTDLDKRKIPVTGWQGILADIGRVRDWTTAGRTPAGLAILIDEGPRYFARFGTGHSWPLSPVTGAGWEHWGDYGQSDVDVHVHRFEVAPF